MQCLIKNNPQNRSIIREVTVIWSDLNDHRFDMIVGNMLVLQFSLHHMSMHHTPHHGPCPSVSHLITLSVIGLVGVTV